MNETDNRFYREAKEIDDGGPAFPWGEHGTHMGGMSLRDRFAIAALPQIQFSQFGVSAFDEIARLAYQQADAMLIARGEA